MGCCRLAVIGILLTVTACGNLTNKDTSRQDAPPAPADSDNATAELVVISNPYLQMSATPPPAAATQYRTAQVAMQAEDWRNASQILQSLTQNYPELSGPYVNLGIVRWRQNQIEQAETLFRKAISVNKLNNDAYNQLGVLLREQGRFDEAESVYKDALAVWPHAPVTLINLAILYDLYMGKFDQALASYELAAQVIEEPSVELQGWIIDLKRRLAEQEANS